jgi:hypothetical protein
LGEEVVDRRGDLSVVWNAIGLVMTTIRSSSHFDGCARCTHEPAAPTKHKRAQFFYFAVPLFSVRNAEELRIVVITSSNSIPDDRQYRRRRFTIFLAK